MTSSTASRRFTSITPCTNSRTICDVLVRRALPALAVALLLAGCGGSSGSAASAATASGSATSSAALSAFETCLKQHGVTVSPRQFGARPTGSFSPGARPTGSFSPGARPTGAPRPRGSFSSQDSAAFKACAKYAPSGFGRGGGPAISSSALAAFKSCLSSHGVQVTGSTANAVLAKLRNSTGKTATAVHTCQVLLQPATPAPAASS